MPEEYSFGLVGETMVVEQDFALKCAGGDVDDAQPGLALHADDLVELAVLHAVGLVGDRFSWYFETPEWCAHADGAAVFVWRQVEEQEYRALFVGGVSFNQQVPAVLIGNGVGIEYAKAVRRWHLDGLGDVELVVTAFPSYAVNVDFVVAVGRVVLRGV